MQHFTDLGVAARVGLRAIGVFELAKENLGVNQCLREDRHWVRTLFYVVALKGLRAALE